MSSIPRIPSFSHQTSLSALLEILGRYSLHLRKTELPGMVIRLFQALSEMPAQQLLLCFKIFGSGPWPPSMSRSESPALSDPITGTDRVRDNEQF